MMKLRHIIFITITLLLSFINANDTSINTDDWCSFDSSFCQTFNINNYNNNNIKIRRVAESSFASEIIGMNLENISDENFDILHSVLLHSKVLIVRNQSLLSVEGQRSLTMRFGPLHEHLESSSHLPNYKDVNVVSNIVDEKGKRIGLFGKHVENFHTDLSWCQLPTKITVLKSVIRPNNCGDTQFIDTNSAYDGLSDELKTTTKNMKANYCYLKTREVSNGQTEGLSQEEISKAEKCSIHPIITTHPITKKKNIYANPSHTASVIGVSEEESNRLLLLLANHSSQPQYIYTHKWEDNDLVLWDNRAVHHRGTGCPDTSLRKLIRTTVSNDEVPVEELDDNNNNNDNSNNSINNNQFIYDLKKDRINAIVTNLIKDEL